MSILRIGPMGLRKVTGCLKDLGRRSFLVKATIATGALFGLCRRAPAPIATPKAGATVNNPFTTTGTVQPPKATVSAQVESRTQPGTTFQGQPKSMQGPNWSFDFNVPADDYTLTISGGNVLDQINITVV